MSLDNFTKHQVVLLILLFVVVTSVATAVATVSLLDDGNAPVTQTIYRVVEKTIESAREPETTVRNIITPTKTETVLSPSDIADRKAASLLRIYRKAPGDRKIFITLAVPIAGKSGAIAGELMEEFNKQADYIASTPDGREIPVTMVERNLFPHISYFSLNYATGDKKVVALDTKGFGTVKLGGSVVTLGGKDESDVISTGIISEFRAGPNPAVKNVAVTDMVLSSALSGWLLFDSSGNLSGFWAGTDEASKTALYIDAKSVRDALGSVE